MTIDQNRAPGSSARDKNNDRNGKGTRWKGRMEVNWAEGIDNPFKAIIVRKLSLEMRARAIIKKTGGIRLVILGTQVSLLMLQVI